MSQARLDLLGLTWTRPQLDQLCLQARQALEAWVAHDDGPQREQWLTEAIEACEKAVGSLALLNCNSGRLMAAAMRDALGALRTHASDPGQNVEAVLEATAILPDYLDHIEYSRTEPVGLILPAINTMRRAARQPVLDQASLFPVELASVRLPAGATDGSTGFAELRRDLQLSLRNTLVQPDESNLGALKTRLLRLRDHSLLPQGLRRMAFALAGLVELIEIGHYPLSNHLSRYFSRLDKLLKEAGSEDDRSVIGTHADRSTRAILHWVAQAAGTTPLCQALSVAFDLPGALAEAALDGPVFLAGRNRELFRCVADAAREELALIQRALESQAAHSRDPESMEEHSERLRSVGQSLAMLGLSATAGLIEQQADRLADLAGATGDPSLPALAEQLMRVESSLSDELASRLEPISPAEQLEQSGISRRPGRRLLRHLGRECLADLSRLRQLLEGADPTAADQAALDSARAILARVGGALRMAGLNEAAEWLDDIDRMIAAECLGRTDPGKPDVMPALAEALTAMEARLAAWTQSADALPAVAGWHMKGRITAPMGSVGEVAAKPSAAAAETLAQGHAVDYARIDADLLDAFVEEARELLEHCDEQIQQWRQSPWDQRIPFALQRNLHTLKGSSRMLGLDPIGRMAHAMEALLERIADGTEGVSSERIARLEVGCDHLNALLQAVSERTNLPVKAVDEAVAETPTRQDARQAEAAPDPASDGPEDSGSARAESLRVSIRLIDELANQASEIGIYRSRLEQRFAELRGNINEVDATIERMRGQLRQLEMASESRIPARFEDEHGPTDSGFDPLEMDRYSAIQQMSRTLAESLNDLTKLSALLQHGSRQSEALLVQQSRASTELQRGLMQARLVSFRTLLPRFQRVVRNSAQGLDRQVELELELEGEGELDRHVLERITAPIEHLLRNAVSHGIESEARRRELGKDPVGRIRIEVRRDATDLLIRLSDDGRGLDLEKIRQAALARKLITADATAGIESMVELIFSFGLSTSAEVSELAGRGIGLSVVSASIRELGGTILVESEDNRGVSFSFRIPLSLTVMQAIVVRVADRQFALPLQGVRGVVRLSLAEWQKQQDLQAPEQTYAGQPFPLLEIESLLEFEAEPPQGSHIKLLMVEAGQHRAALKVGELVGHQEVVIKPIGPQVRSIVGILGATLSADGEIMPILDLKALLQRTLTGDAAPALRPGASRQTRRGRMPLILIVDDSLTMRRVTSRVLEQSGFAVLSARDGVEALETMAERTPDLLLLDIEMPRMDGYALAEQMRRDQRLRHIPIMMLTSRSGDKHRQRALALGVNDYMPKPYQEADLISRIRALLHSGDARTEHGTG